MSYTSLLWNAYRHLKNRVSSQPTTCDTVTWGAHTWDSGHDYITPGVMFLNKRQHIIYTVHVGIHCSIQKLNWMKSVKLRPLRTTHKIIQWAFNAQQKQTKIKHKQKSDDDIFCLRQQWGNTIHFKDVFRRRSLIKLNWCTCKALTK